MRSAKRVTHLTFLTLSLLFVFSSISPAQPIAPPVDAQAASQMIVHHLRTTSSPGDVNWDSGFGIPGVGNLWGWGWSGNSGGDYDLGMGEGVRDIVVVGSLLYVVGDFDVAGSVPSSGLAVWDGTSWSSLGVFLDEDGYQAEVRLLATDGSNLYVCGSFETVDGFEVNGIAVWNGSWWDTVGAGLGWSYDEVVAMTVSGSNVYVMGDFWGIGEVEARGAAVWNGTTWAPLGAGLEFGSGSSEKGAIAISGSDIYFGGSFDGAGGNYDPQWQYLAKWNGASWEALGAGVDSYVNAIAIDGGNVYVSGDFDNAGGAPAARIARWNGAAWSALGSGIDMVVYDLVASGGNLYVGGEFHDAGGISIEDIAVWNGSAWSTPAAMGNISASGGIRALAKSGSDLYVGGVIIGSWEDGLFAPQIARWDGSGWHGCGNGGATHRVSDLTVRGGGGILAGGDFWFVDQTIAPFVSTRNDTDWVATCWGVSYGAGPDEDLGKIYAVANAGGDIYIAGDFEHVRTSMWGEGVSANYVARRVGSTWEPLGSGLNAPAHAIAVDGSDVYVGGQFTTAGGQWTNYIARWDTITSTWSPLSAPQNNGVNNVVRSLLVSGGDLYAGGEFTWAGDVQAAHIAKWNGSTWSSLGNGTNDVVMDMAEGVDGIYVGGRFTTAGTAFANRVARWTGAEWHPLGPGVAGGRDDPGDDAEELPIVNAVVARLNGEVFIGGQFKVAGNVDASNIARWDGASWSPLGSGVGGTVLTLVNTPLAVWVGGDFRTAGDKVSTFLARWNEGDVVHVASQDAVPAHELHQNCPNPFNPTTTIRYALAEPTQVSIRIFDVAGRHVRTLVDEKQGPVKGGQAVTWDGTADNGAPAASGVYFCRMATRGGAQSMKMVLLK